MAAEWHPKLKSEDMKTIAFVAALLAAAIASPAAASEGSVCLQIRQIDRTKVLDAKTILFKMKDGKVWRNALRSSCPGLRFDGFVYVVHDDEVCGNMQTIRVLRSHEVCMLGPFTPEASWPK